MSSGLQKRKVVIALIWSSEGMILLGRRSEEKKLYPGLWQAVAGGIEPWESPLDALHREVLEECGLALTLVDRVQQLPIDLEEEHFDSTIFDIHLGPEIRSIHPNPEFTELRWFRKEELPHLRLVPGAYALFQSRLPELFKGGERFRR